MRNFIRMARCWRRGPAKLFRLLVKSVPFQHGREHQFEALTE